MSPFDEPDRFFAIGLGRASNVSSFTVGEVDLAFANSTADFAYTDVWPSSGSVYDYWKIPIQSISVNSTTFPLSSSRVHGSSSPIAVFDTGTTLVLGPTDDVDRLWQSIGGARKTEQGWQVRCDRAMVIGMVLGEGDSVKEYAIDPADLSWMDGGHDGEWCMGGVQANDDVRECSAMRAIDLTHSPPSQVSSADWLLGDTFLRVGCLTSCQLSYPRIDTCECRTYISCTTLETARILPWLGC